MTIPIEILWELENLNTYGNKYKYAYETININMEYKRFERERNEYYKELGISQPLLEKINKTFQYIWISPSLNELTNPLN